MSHHWLVARPAPVLLLSRHLGINFNEILIKIQTFSVKNAFQISSVKWWPFCFGIKASNQVFNCNNYKNSRQNYCAAMSAMSKGHDTTVNADVLVHWRAMPPTGSMFSWMNLHLWNTLRQMCIKLQNKTTFTRKGTENWRLQNWWRFCIGLRMFNQAMFCREAGNLWFLFWDNAPCSDLET